MNAVAKIILAILGACNVVISILLPILVALIAINTLTLGNVASGLLATIGGLASLYRGIKVFFVRS